MSHIPVIEIAGGLTVMASTDLKTDYVSMRVLVESGVSYLNAAKAFKVSERSVRQRALRDGWLTPAKVESLRREIEAKQSEIFRRSGKTRDVNEIKAEIWVERGEKLREKSFNIVSAALEGVTDESASNFIRNPKGLLEIITATRLVTGEEKADAAAGTSVAVNIGFLRSQRPTDVVMDAETV